MARIDAARNRQRLLDAARQVFCAQGLDASLESVARNAGLGIATLYRNWPTRSALMAEVYATEVDDLVTSPERLVAEHPPEQALRLWVERVFEMAPILGPVADGDLHNTVVDALEGSLTVLLDANQATMGGIAPRELLMVLGGIPLALPQPHDRQRALALADLVFDGLRYRANT